MTVLVHRPIQVEFANLVGAMPAFRGHLSDSMLTVVAHRLSNSKLGGVGLFCEADDCNPRSVLGPQGKDFWWVHQSGHNLDGVLIIGTVNRTHHGEAVWHSGAPQSRVNDPRPILTCPIVVDPHSKRRSWRRVFSVMHSPKPDGGEAAAHVMDINAKRLDPDVWGADHNRRLDAMKRAYPGRKFGGSEVVFLSSNNRVRMSKVAHYDVLHKTRADDHPGLSARVWPRGA